jgi:hypothetical protein
MDDILTKLEEENIIFDTNDKIINLPQELIKKYKAKKI